MTMFLAEVGDTGQEVEFELPTYDRSQRQHLAHDGAQPGHSGPDHQSDTFRHGHGFHFDGGRPSTTVVPEDGSGLRELSKDFPKRKMDFRRFPGRAHERGLTPIVIEVVSRGCLHKGDDLGVAKPRQGEVGDSWLTPEGYQSLGQWVGT